MALISIPSSPKATGGDVRVIHLSGTNYVMHVFEDSGYFVVPTDITGCTVIVVGGGGGGGASIGNNDTGKGGGGAGGLLFRDNFTIADSTYEIGIGLGGYHPFQRGLEANPQGGWSMSGMHGGDTHFVEWNASSPILHVHAMGGGGGGGGDNNGYATEGGSGGGGGARNSNGGWNDGRPSNQPSFSNWTKRGNTGGNSANGNYSGGGGGGAGGGGENYKGGTNSGTGGDGGVGYDYSSFFGTIVGDRGWFAGGGGGATYRTSAYTNDQSTLGQGGKGGGGNGMWTEEESAGSTYASQKINGMRGTGGGGGGSGESGQNVTDGGGIGSVRHGATTGTGGTGIVIIRYAQ